MESTSRKSNKIGPGKKPLLPRKLKPALGWREWCSLPELGIEAIKCKVDTGAKTSCIHADELHVYRKSSKEFVTFKVHPLQKNSRKFVVCEAELIEWRNVTDSGGKRTRRPVVRTWLSLGDFVKEIELTLINRDEMGFRMLLGRQALKKTWVVDPARSFVQSSIKGNKKHLNTTRKVH